MTFIVIFILSFHGINFFNNSFIEFAHFTFFCYGMVVEKKHNFKYISGYTRLLFFYTFYNAFTALFLTFSPEIVSSDYCFLCVCDFFITFRKMFLLLLLLIGLFHYGFVCKMEFVWPKHKRKTFSWRNLRNFWCDKIFK